jgi:concanavalin A-like lectin/glucanase superfamily protein/F5/8 type C domain-containing protein
MVMCKKLMLICVALVAAFGFIRTASAELIGYWSFDEGSGEIAKDGSGNGNDGTLENGTEWTDGQSGYAVLFDGTDDCVNLGNGGSLSITDDFTFSMWVKISAYPTSWRNMLSKLVDDQHVEYNFRYKTATEGQFYYGTGSAAIVCMWNPTEDLPLNTWTHIAGVRKSKTHLKLYFNGVEKRTLSITTEAVSTDANVTIGRQSNNTFYFNGMIDEVAIFSDALEEAAIRSAMSGLGDRELASMPNPGEEAVDVPLDVVLGWVAGESAATHDVYFGASSSDVDDATRANPMGVLVSQGQTDATYDPDGLLDFETAYYWRVDEVNAAPDNTIFEGNVWSFTTEPVAFPIEGVLASSSVASQAGAGPENTVDGSGLNAADEHSVDLADMWLTTTTTAPFALTYEFDKVYKLHEMLVWNYNVQFELALGFGVKDVSIEYSADGAEWETLGDTVFAQGTTRADYTANTMVAFDGVAAQYVRMTVNSGYGPLGQFGLSELRFTYIPAQAREPQPADGTTEVSPNTGLSWRAGRDALSHEIYVSTDEQAVVDGTALVDATDESRYPISTLEFGATYYWKVNEVQDVESWAGAIWNFSTEAFALIDGFEAYDDEDNRIYDTWIDGWVNETGSTVGYFETPFAERTIVNSGSQSMPLEYDNSVSPFYAEAEYDLGGMDLDTKGADTLRLFVAGTAPSFEEAADGTIVMNAIGDDIWNAADQLRYVYRQLTGDGSMTARVEALDGAPSTWAKGGVMIRQSTEAGAINTFMAMTGGDGGGATYQQRMVADDVSVSQNTYDDGPLAPPYWVRVTREGNTLLGYTSPDGETWTQRGETVTLAMADPVLIGLALTSHNTAAVTSAAFSNVSFTGNVTGSWEFAEIGVAQPTGGNAIEPLYVAVEDTSGHVAVVANPNPVAGALSAWQEWLIPYSELTGVNLNSVSTMYIGVGDRNNPSSGGTGLIFIDDVSYGRPMLQP